MKLFPRCRGSFLKPCLRVWSFVEFFLPARFRLPHLIVIAVFLPAAYYQYKYNAIDYVLSLPFYFFTYPLDVDMPALVSRVMKGQPPGAAVITRDDYPFVLNNDKLCKTADGGDDDIYLLLVIKSALNNTEARNTIRRTWAQEYNVPGVTVKHVFILGVHPGAMKLQQKIAQEHEQWEDVAQGYFLDSYFNNTIKLMMGFRWATTNCKGARFIAFVDDDFFISPFNLVTYLQNRPKKEVETTIYGYAWEYAVPFRYKASKWYLSREEYPYRFFPPYPAAGAFFLSHALAQPLYIAMHYTQYFRFDDVFVGIVAWKLQVPVKNCDLILFHPTDRHKVRQRHRNIIAAHGFKDVNILQKTWDEHMDYRHAHRDNER